MHPHPAPTLIAGATGLVGQSLLAQAPPGTPLWLIGRRPAPSGLLPAGASWLQVATLAQPGPLPPLERACIALGTTIGQAGSQAAFRAVDFDAVLGVATAARAAGVRRLAVVSALGADAGSRVFYNRVKGETEAALQALGFARLVLARPSLLDGDRSALGQSARRAEGWSLRLARPLAPLIPARWRPIAATTVARAMWRALADDQPDGLRILENDDLARLGA